MIGLAIESNYRASFGSFLVTNVAPTEPAAFKIRQWMAGRPFSGIAAPHVDPIAVALQAQEGHLPSPTNPALGDLGVRSLATAPISCPIRGATLTQTPNSFVPKLPKAWDAGLVADMCLAWGICAASDSICISVVKNQILIANALGQQERAAACELAVLQAKKARRTAWLNGAAGRQRPVRRRPRLSRAPQGRGDLRHERLDPRQGGRGHAAVRRHLPQGSRREGAHFLRALRMARRG